jgi:anti-sigma B factor antagonist
MARCGERVERSSGAAPPRQPGGSGSNGPTPLTVRIEREDDGVSVVALAGELDLGTIPDLEGALFEELRIRTGVMVDLTRLVFIDSSGIGLLIKASGLRSDPGAMHIAIAPGSQVERVFGLTGIDRALPVFVGHDEALAALRGRHGEPEPEPAG